MKRLQKATTRFHLNESAFDSVPNPSVIRHDRTTALAFGIRKKLFKRGEKERRRDARCGVRKERVHKNFFGPIEPSARVLSLTENDLRHHFEYKRPRENRLLRKRTRAIKPNGNRAISAYFWTPMIRHIGVQK